MAQSTLSQLKERIAGEDAAGALNWFRVDTILESPSISTYTKYYSMQVGFLPFSVNVLDLILLAHRFWTKRSNFDGSHFHQSRCPRYTGPGVACFSHDDPWQCAGIKTFVVNLVIQRSSNEEVDRSSLRSPLARLVLSHSDPQVFVTMCSWRPLVPISLRAMTSLCSIPSATAAAAAQTF